MSMNFDGRVAIVTGAGNGLGRSHAIALASRGAKVVVNDLGGMRDGTGASLNAAQAVVDEITAKGGEAIAHGANVARYDEVADMTAAAMSKWGRIDILINNAGVLRDKTFAKMTLEDFRLVLDVHLMGAVHCTKAVWDTMCRQEYGRIVMTTSNSGLYGNFGQSNYGAAKMGLIGLMNTLCIEGRKFNVRVNALAPIAGTRMTEDLMARDVFDRLTPESVSAAALVLCGPDAPTKAILCAAAGAYAAAAICESEGVYLSPEAQTPEAIAANWDAIASPSTWATYSDAQRQAQKLLALAMKGAG